jgi:hypothetical protein
VINGSGLKIVAIVGLIALMYLLPSSNVEAAKFQSGVTIKAATPSECTDTNKDGVDDNTGAACGKAPAEPPSKCLDANGDGADDNTGAACSRTPTAEGTCGLQISHGVPINYGELAIGQDSPEQAISILNEGTSQTPAKVMIKATPWLSDELQAGVHVSVADEGATRVSLEGLTYDNKKPLTAGAQEIGQLAGGEARQIFFQLKLNNPPPPGFDKFHQDVTIDLLC